MASDERLLSVDEISYVLSQGKLPQSREDEAQKLGLASLDEEGRLTAILRLILPVLYHLFATNSGHLIPVLENLAIRTREGT